MDFDELINQHLKWKFEVENYLNEDDSSKFVLDSFVSDDQCELGKWLYSDQANTLLSIELLQELIKIHSEFHYITKSIINNFRYGYTNSAKELITEYTQYSDKLVTRIRQIQKELK